MPHREARASALPPIGAPLPKRQLASNLCVCASPSWVYGGRTFLTAEQQRLVDHAVSAPESSVGANGAAPATAKERKSPRKRARSR